MAISDFLTDRSAVQFGRPNTAISGVANTVSSGIVEGVRNGITEFLNDPGGAPDADPSAFAGYGQTPDWGPLRDKLGLNEEAGVPGYGESLGMLGGLAASALNTSFPGGLVGNAIGTVIDQRMTDPVLEAFGQPTQGFGGWLEGFGRSALPGPMGRILGLMSPEQQMFRSLAELDYGDSGWSDRWSSEDRARDRINELSGGFTDAAGLEGYFDSRDISGYFDGNDDSDGGGYDAGSDAEGESGSDGRGSNEGASDW